MSSARRHTVSGATSLGLSTTVQPAARPGPPSRRSDEREVPGRDAADNSDRFADEQYRAVTVFELDALDVLGHVRERAGGELRVHVSAKRERGSNICCRQHRQFVDVREQRLGDRSEQCGPKRDLGVAAQGSNAVRAATAAASTSAGSPAGTRAISSLGCWWGSAPTASQGSPIPPAHAPPIRATGCSRARSSARAVPVFAYHSVDSSDERCRRVCSCRQLREY